MVAGQGKERTSPEVTRLPRVQGADADWREVRLGGFTAQLINLLRAPDNNNNNPDKPGKLARAYWSTREPETPKSPSPRAYRLGGINANSGVTRV